MAGIYIHIPYCKTKCSYCDFYSIGNKIDSIEYLASLTKELKLRLDEISGENINTIYIGGGTPSLLSIVELRSLVLNLKEIIPFQYIEEFTIELNPDDITLDYAIAIREMGINRVSVGIQSFNDNELKCINRRHSAEEAEEAIKILQKANFDNISIDLIYGLPLQSLDSFYSTIKRALSLNVQHISAYNLMYEDGTRLSLMKNLGKIKECSEDDSIKMYNLLINSLKEFGFIHYEISNFALPDKFSLHNRNYWNYTPYIGLGVSAHSFDGKWRRYNPNNIKDYVACINGGKTYYLVEKENLYELYDEYIMTSLRTIWGTDLNMVKSRFSSSLHTHCLKEAQSYIKSGDLILKDNHLFLSERGMMISDAIFRDLFYVE